MLTKAELIGQIQARLAGRQSEAELAAWAFDRFYACELGNEMLDPLDSGQITAVLDDLMFATDDPHFALNDESLRALVKQLEEQ